jgi:hypothetical protein
MRTARGWHSRRRGRRGRFPGTSGSTRLTQDLTSDDRSLRWCVTFALRRVVWAHSPNTTGDRTLTPPPPPKPNGCAPQRMLDSVWTLCDMPTRPGVCARRAFHVSQSDQHSPDSRGVREARDASGERAPPCSAKATWLIVLTPHRRRQASTAAGGRARAHRGGPSS